MRPQKPGQLQNRIAEGAGVIERCDDRLDQCRRLTWTRSSLHMVAPGFQPAMVGQNEIGHGGRLVEAAAETRNE